MNFFKKHYKNILTLLLGYSIIVSLDYLDSKSNIMFFITLAIFYSSYRLGSFFGKKYKEKSKVINYIKCSNIITWILPVIGIFTASATLELNKNKKKLKYIAFACILLSIINTAFFLIPKMGLRNANSVDSVISKANSYLEQGECTNTLKTIREANSYPNKTSTQDQQIEQLGNLLTKKIVESACKDVDSNN